MGTRGTFGFRSNGKDKLGYNQFDSYPSGRGVVVLEELKEILKTKGVDYLKQRVDAMRLVSDEEKPTAEDIEKLKPYTDLGVSRQSTDDWYCLTRKSHGDIKLMLEAGYMGNSNEFINDSLFCEWGYIINLDDNVLEVYKGFQSEEHNLGRYADNKPDRGYYPCALIATFPFDNLPSEEEFLAKLEPPEEEEATA